MSLSLRLSLRGCSLTCLFKNQPSSLYGLQSQWPRALFTTPSVAAIKAQSSEDFWSKNARLHRPVSPHMTIYKPQITSILSLAHRATGLALSGIMSAFSIGMLTLPGSYPYYLNYISSLQIGGGLIFATKFAIAFPFMFHLCNGVRHLVWDLGYGFTLRTLYKTGYLVASLSVILSLVVAAM